MENGSVIISKIIIFFKMLNRFYENSVTYKAVKKIEAIAVKGLIVGSVCKVLKKANHNNYIEGSLLMMSIFKVFNSTFSIIKKMYLSLAGFNSKSANKNLFDKLVLPLTKLEKSVPAAASLLFGFFSIRTILAIISQYGFTSVAINATISVIFLILAFIDFDFLSKSVNGSTPKKLITWLFSD